MPEEESSVPHPFAFFAKGWESTNPNPPVSIQHEKWVPHISILRCGNTRISLSTKAGSAAANHRHASRRRPSLNRSLRRVHLSRTQLLSRSNRRLLRRLRREDLALRGFRFRLWLRCFLGFFSAFIFASHAASMTHLPATEKYRKRFPVAHPFALLAKG